MQSPFALVLWLALCFATAGFGSIPTARALKTWYPSLRKPSWNPPNWLFGPVWTALYFLMAVAAWNAWNSNSAVRNLSIALFVIQLVLNGLWSWIFFGWKSPGAAFAEIIVLWIAIIATILGFTQVSPLAAALMAPYLAWVSFASYLNFAIWRLNSTEHPVSTN